MITLKIEDAKFLENNNSEIKFCNIKETIDPKTKKLKTEVISKSYAKIIEKTTKETWIDWTLGETHEEAAENAVEQARINLNQKPVTSIESVKYIKSKENELEKAKKRIKDLEAKINHQ